MSSDQGFDVGKYTIPRSDQINSEDFLAGPKTFTVRHVREKGGAEQPVEIFLEEVDRPWRPCKTTMRVLAYGWGPYTGDWRGRQVTLYRDPSVKWGGAEVGGIRVSAMSDLAGDKARGFVIALTKSKGSRGNVEVRALKREGQAQPPAPRQDDAPAAQVPADLLAKAELAAGQGTTTLEGWWRNTATKEERAALQPRLADLKATAKRADDKGAPTEDDPFTVAGDPPREREPGED